MSETNATATGPAPAGPPPAGGWPPGRYGRRREPRVRPRWLRRSVVAVLLAGVVLGGTGAAYLLGQQYGPGRPYDATVVRFYDITDTQVVIEFTVVVPDGEAARCAVRARAGHGGEVGRAEVRVDPPPGQSRPVVTHRLSTSERPATGEVGRCWRAR